MKEDVKELDLVPCAPDPFDKEEEKGKFLGVSLDPDTERFYKGKFLCPESTVQMTV